MQRNYLHLILLPILITIVITGCFPVDSKGMEYTETGGICILKTDVIGRPLEGARFRIAREATRQELNDSSVEKSLLRADEQYITVVYESFYTDSANQKEARTEDDGKVFIYGLPYGSYYLVESGVPAGYQRMKEPIRIRIHKYSHLTEADEVRDDNGVLIDNTLHIITLRYTIPVVSQMDEITIIAAFVAALFSLISLLLIFSRRHKCV